MFTDFPQVFLDLAVDAAVALESRGHQQGVQPGLRIDNGFPLEVTRALDRVFDPPLRSQNPRAYFFPVCRATMNTPLNGHAFPVAKPASWGWLATFE